jgi:hypothetical protein
VPRYALRVDANQGEIVRALEEAGYQVEVIGKPVDLLVGNAKTGRFMFQEAKVPGGKPTQFQRGFFERWGGYASISMVDGPEAALRHARAVLGTP